METKDIFEIFFRNEFKTTIGFIHETGLLIWHVVNIVVLLLGISLAVAKIKEKYKRVLLVVAFTSFGLFIIAEQLLRFFMFGAYAIPYIDGILFYLYFALTYIGNR